MADILHKSPDYSGGRSRPNVLVPQSATQPHYVVLIVRSHLTIIVGINCFTIQTSSA
jgi:hypothetical protein